MVYVLVACLAVLGASNIYLAIRRRHERCERARMKQMLDLLAKLDKAREIRLFGDIRGDPVNYAKFVNRSGKTAYAVASKDAVAVAYVRAKAEAIPGNTRIFFGDGDAFPFAAVLSRAADFGFASPESVARATRKLSLAQRQNTAIVGRTKTEDGDTVLVIGRSL